MRDGGYQYYRKKFAKLLRCANSNLRYHVKITFCAYGTKNNYITKKRLLTTRWHHVINSKVRIIASQQLPKYYFDWWQRKRQNEQTRLHYFPFVACHVTIQKMSGFWRFPDFRIPDKGFSTCKGYCLQIYTVYIYISILYIYIDEILYIYIYIYIYIDR